ncbi:helix-turn-helix domain-containing protein [Sphingobacterium sp. N143]|uniref:AraC family transcriptional regulator n=1 Tax=Sphingobacterium sp. N143 TaxID=2746727 RepID=UPI0025773BA2|nr:helix-turn-helix transcriptional regulator [Sphingobacterium sp. N143]MDM1293310.1 helix-turn-helix domain-containing protein [Sphingobacterium sp. N143]
MYHPTDHFPILDLQKFYDGVMSDRHLLFHELVGKREIEEPHKHDFFILLLFEKSTGSHTIDFSTFSLGTRQLHLIFPGQVHHWRMVDPTHGLQLMISRSWFESLLPALRFPISYYLKHLVIDLSEHHFQALWTEFRAISYELKDKDILWELIYGRVKVIALLISKVVQDNFDDYEPYQDNPIMAKFVQLIDEWYKTERSVAFYAERLNISANYLNVLSNKIFQASASSLIQNRVLLEAKRLLKVSDKTIKDIVFDLGFYDNASFSKFFKSHTHMTPSQFKSQP